MDVQDINEENCYASATLLPLLLKSHINVGI